MLAACTQYKDGEPVVKETDEPKEEVKQEKPKEEPKEEPKKEETEKEEKAEKAKKDDNKIKIEDKFTFANFTVAMDYVRVYEEKDKNYADINFNWLNQAGDGKKTFMQLSAMDVEQGDAILEETTGAWDPTNKNSKVYFPNAENGETSVKLTYELKNNEEPIVITFVPLTGEGSEKVTVNID